MITVGDSGAAHEQPLAVFVRPLRCKDEPGSDSGVADFVAQLVTGEVVEPISGAMAGDDVIRIDFLHGRHNLADVGIVKPWNAAAAIRQLRDSPKAPLVPFSDTV